MTEPNRTPLYNLSAVLRETGLQADVLRAWERRYELPQPQRSLGGHRLYSEYDLLTIKWLCARQAEGFRISQAVELWKEIATAGRDPLFEYTPPLPLISAAGTTLEILQKEWVKACLNFDAPKAEEIAAQAFAMFPVETVCLDVLQKSISQIGALWYQNEASVQQEHFATALAVQKIEALISALPKSARPQTILIGCPSGEWHTFPALILSFLLRRKGWNVVYLGANVPLDQMEQTAAMIRPSLIILAAQQLRTAAALHSAAVLFLRLGIPLAYGGLIFSHLPEIRDRIPAHFLGDDLHVSVNRIEQLLASRLAAPAAVRIEDIYSQTTEAFRSRLLMIHTRVMEQLSQESLPVESLLEVNDFFATAILSGLELGNLAFLEFDLEWLRKLLIDRNIPVEKMTPYLDAYRQSIDLEMGQAGLVITAWMSAYQAAHHS